MPRHPIITLPALTLHLQAEGPQTAARLAEAAGVHRSQVSRTLSGAGDAIVQIGAARRARYAMRRTVRAAGDRWPVFRIDEAGRAHEWARLEAFHGGWRLIWAGEPPAWAELACDGDGWAEGFPFFFTDLHPQGFLGRALARRVAGPLLLPDDPTRWSDDDTLVFLQSEGDDLPGNLVVGDAPLRRVLARQVSAPGDAVDEADRGVRYPGLAAQAMQEGVPGSSAGGEQPKFLAHLRAPDGPRAVLVKFSQPLDTPAGRRWADLLAAEAHALGVLVGAGEAEAGARVLDAGGRRFLEVPRFDRAGTHGRRGVVSLAALHAARSDGVAANWIQAAERLAAAGLLTPEDLAAVRRRQAFGELIGNTDMHFGNLAFWLDGTPPFRLAPAYDMLPMLWAPAAGGELVPRAFAPLPPVPAMAGDWGAAAGWAAEFWARVAADAGVSPEFAAIAREAGVQVARLRERFG